MSAGWEVKPLGIICKNLDRQRIPITKRDRVEGEYPYYGASGIVDYVDKYIFDEDLLLVSEDGANLLARTYPIAFSVSGKIWVNNHAHVLRFDNSNTQKFVEYYLNSIKLDDYVSGMAQPKLNQKSLNSIMVPVPPIEEQRRIVAMLDEALAGVQQVTANTERNLANTQELFNAHLQAIFADIYKTHEAVKMSDLSIEITDGDHSPPPKSQTGIPFITISNINKETRQIDFSDTFMVPEEYYRNLKDKRKPIKGDLLYTVTG